jgi:hypothetical protein
MDQNKRTETLTGSTRNRELARSIQCFETGNRGTAAMVKIASFNVAQQWEYSHAVSAILDLAALIGVITSVLSGRKP